MQWLVENTGVRDKVKCKDGERSLLHIAAKYAQEEVSEHMHLKIFVALVLFVTAGNALYA